MSMDDTHLDLILRELSKNGTDQIEASEEVLENLNLKGASLLNNSEIVYLINQGYLLREVINGFNDRQGKFSPARYLLSLTPQGLKYIREGGFAAKSGYTKKTLTVATQSRNWSIIAVGIAVIALFLQFYYGSCNNNVELPAASNPPLDTVVKVIIDTNKSIQDSSKAQSGPIDSVKKGNVKHLPSKKKKKASSGSKN